MLLKCNYNLTFRICDLWKIICNFVIYEFMFSLIVLPIKTFYVFPPGGAQLAGSGEWRRGGTSCSYLKTEAKCPGLRGKKFLIVFIYGLSFSFKMLFLKPSRRKSPKFLLVGSLFHVM